MTIANKIHCEANLLLAIDPGEHAGYAVWIERALTSCGTVDGSTAREPAELIDRLGPNAIAVEDWFAAPRRGLKTYAYRNALWRALAEARGIPVEIITSMAWQSWAGMRRGDKTAIQRIAAGFTAEAGLAAPGPDEADAILIGAYTVSYLKR